ncbi:hypothetical protein NEMBOFW57_003777 [Staphylotrichum longicolle]|uniref:Myb transcription factor n=1 Tax=Staphylotrichum longicolle TaxID=669026 RepID=A0AAD4F6W0_9PEZI|nr:hypothetical protein NEMBOFW57_003777 [Staphylotrichum longicolle]
MPATLSTAFNGPGSPGAPDQSPEAFAHSATQPERSERKKARSSKKRTKTKHPEPIITFEDFKKHRRRSEAPSPLLLPNTQLPLEESETAIILENQLPSQEESPKQAGPSRKGKGKGKEAVRGPVPEDFTAVADPSTFDLDDEAPPSAQPLGKRGRRDSDSRARKKRKTPRRSSVGSDHGLRTGPSDEHPQQPAPEHTNGDVLSEDDIKAEPADAADPLIITQSQPSAFHGDNPQIRPAFSELLVADSQRALSDSGHADPDAQVTSGRNASPGRDLPDGLPRLETSHHSSMDGGGGSVADDDSMSVQSAPHGLPAASDMSIPLTAEHARDAQAPIGTHDGPDLDEVDNLFSANDEPDRRNDATSPQLALPRRDDEEADNHEEADDHEEADSHEEADNRAEADSHEEADTNKEAPNPVQRHANLASTSLEPSPKPSGLTRSVKRKAKKPFLPRQEEENAHAFAALPLDDVVSPSRSRRPKTAQPTAQVLAGPSAVAPRKERKKAPKQPTEDSAAELSDGQIPAGGSQYRSGQLSRTEQNQIIRAVDRFREDEGLTQEELIRVIHDNPQTSTQAVNRQLWASIQDACPSRPRRKLIGWCRQRFHNFAGRGTWTQEQDDELADLVEKHGKKWSFIAGLINRHQKDVRDRWRNYLICRDNVKTDAWSEGEKKQFRDLVESSIEQIREGLSENSNKSPEDLINWLHISDAMGRTRSRLQCMEKWKRMRAAEPLADKVPTVLPPGSSWRLEKARRELRKLTAEDKYILMRTVRDSRVGTDAKINWKQIVSGTFGDRYERQTLVVTWGRLRKAVPDWEWKTTRDCAQYLCDMYESEGNFRANGDVEMGNAEDDLLDETAPSIRKRAKKSKAAARSSSVDTAASSPRNQTTNGVESHKETEEAPAPAKGSKSTSKKLREKRGKLRGKTESNAAVPDTANESAKSADEDAELEDPQSPTKSRSLSTKKRRRPVERDSSPDVEIGAQPLSPSVEAHAARSKRRERRESIGEDSNAKGQEQDIAAPAADSASAKVSKRLRRGSLTGGENADSPLSKKQKTSKNSKVYGRTGKVRADRPPNTFNGKSWSVISSDMDDMEDIPATLPTSSQAAH